MATRKRKRSTKRRVVRHTAPRRVALKRRHKAVHRSMKRRLTVSHHNPVHRRRRNRVYHRRRHHRNPFGGATGDILNYTIAGLAQGLATPIVGGFAARFLPFGQFNAPIITFGTGWLLSKAFGMFSFTRRFAHASFVFGAAAAAMQVLQPIVARTIGGGGAPANPTLSGYRNGYPMRGIGVMPGIPEGIPLGPGAQARPGMPMMSGMGAWPGMYAR